MMIQPPTTVSGAHQGTNYSSHAISRSTELLSCARTALRIAQQEAQLQLKEDPTFQVQLPAELISIDPNQLVLHKSANRTSSSHDLNALDNFDSDSTPSNEATEALHEATDTLQQIDKTLLQISSLVKQRLITNDPTHSINSAMAQFNKDTQELMEILTTILPRAALIPVNGKASSKMRKQHYERISLVLKGMVDERGKRFKEIMAVRGKVLKEMALEKDQLFKSESKSNKKKELHQVGPPLSGNLAHINGGIKPPPKTHIRKPVTKLPTMKTNGAKSQLNSPLFNMPAPPPKKSATSHTTSLPPTTSQGHPTSHLTKNNSKGMSYGNVNQNQNSAYSGNGMNNTSGYYSGANGYTGYGDNSIGIRRRGAAANTTHSVSYGGYGSNSVPAGTNNSYNPYGQEHDEDNKGHGSGGMTIEQVQARRQNRQTANRLELAREAEKSLAELTTMFGKMSSLIASQGETVEKIEDEVGIAMGHVDAGAEEITKLYELTQGNRALIFKVFGILIFFIVFMKWYG